LRGEEEGQGQEGLLMPTYVYECPRGHTFERILRVADHATPQRCDCGRSSQRIITAPTLFVKQEIRYDSPIDGRAITSMKARRDDLARNNCQEYDPEMKKDYKRRIERQQAALEKSVESTVEATIEQMPARKRERLESELRAGADCAPERQAAPFKSTTKVKHGH
jgi:putative FmdB family regulatory protein